MLAQNTGTNIGRCKMNATGEHPIQSQMPSGNLFDTYSTIEVTEATGTFFLGILAVILLILMSGAINDVRN
jgi:hypothetical protein